MSNFKVGDRVVCVDDSLQNPQNVSTFTLKKGTEYIIQEIKICSCGAKSLVVGAIGIRTLGIWFCASCKSGDSKIINDFSASRFRKVIEQPRVIRIEVERTEPVLN